MSHEGRNIELAGGPVGACATSADLPLLIGSADFNPTSSQRTIDEIADPLQQPHHTFNPLEQPNHTTALPDTLTTARLPSTTTTASPRRHPSPQSSHNVSAHPTQHLSHLDRSISGSFNHNQNDELVEWKLTCKLGLTLALALFAAFIALLLSALPAPYDHGALYIAFHTSVYLGIITSIAMSIFFFILPGTPVLKWKINCSIGILGLLLLLSCSIRLIVSLPHVYTPYVWVMFVVVSLLTVFYLWYNKESTLSAYSNETGADNHSVRVRSAAGFLVDHRRHSVRVPDTNTRRRTIHRS